MTLLPNKVPHWGTGDEDSASEFWGNTNQPGTERQEETEQSVVSQKTGGNRAECGVTEVGVTYLFFQDSTGSCALTHGPGPEPAASCNSCFPLRQLLHIHWWGSRSGFLQAPMPSHQAENWNRTTKGKFYPTLDLSSVTRLTSYMSNWLKRSNKPLQSASFSAADVRTSETLSTVAYDWKLFFSKTSYRVKEKASIPSMLPKEVQIIKP